VSKMLADLEHQLGFQLAHRDPRGRCLFLRGRA
jgi:DNA-binding transcriptional LysR family regulator